MALSKRLAAIAVSSLTAAAAATAALTGPASAAALVECETEGGYWDCYIPSWYDSERWYYDGVLVPAYNDQPSAWGTCVPGTGHTIRVTFSGGSSRTSFRCA